MQYREVLEVCKWLGAEDVLRHIWTSHMWAKAADSEELWELLAARFQLNQGEHPKTGFRRLTQAFKSLVIVRPTEVRIFSVRQKRWTESNRLSQRLQVDDFTSTILLPDASILCCGGSLGAPWRSAYRVLIGGLAQPLSSLLIPRSGHGLAVCERMVCAFGGCGGGSSEALEWAPLNSLALRSWRRLPNMLTARSYFTPCVVRRMIYLCGGFTDCCEVFDSERESYRVLAVWLPESSEVCAVLEQHELLLLSPRFTSRLNLRSLELESVKHVQWAGVWGSMNAIMHEHTVCAPFATAVNLFDLRTHEKSSLKA